MNFYPRPDAADKANLDGYEQGYADGYDDGAAIVQTELDDLRDQLRLVLWHHHEALASRDWRINPRKVLHMYSSTVAGIRRVVGD